MTVNPTRFASAMGDHWQGKLRLHLTPALTACWKQMAEILNAQIEGNSTGWKVLQLPTGTGKTKGLEKYCSMLPKDDHPGVLIVTRLKEDADEIALNINALSASSKTAIAFHTDTTDVAPDDLGNFPVLVITHAAYKVWAQAFVPRYAHDKWIGGTRRLVVIDEALAIIEQTQVHLDQVKSARGQIARHIEAKTPHEITRLDQIIQKMHEIADTSKNGNRLIMPDEWQLPEDVRLSHTLRNLRNEPFDHSLLERQDTEERCSLADRFCSVLKITSELPETWCLYAQKGNYLTFTTASVIVPRHKMNAVVLDATASCNPIYRLLGDKVKVILPPQPTRNYANVTLHASIGHKVGKLFLEDAAKEEIPAVLGELAGVISTKSKIFMCAHKAVEAHLHGYEGLPPYDVAHWGAIDGKNTWKDCDTAFFYGLPFLDLIVPETTLLAIEDWRGKAFPVEKRDALVHELAIGHMVTSLVQGINRVRCRCVTDSKGNCDKTDIYVLLPDKRRAQEILSGIEVAMPGIKIVEWQSKAAKRKVKRSKFEKPLVAFLAAAKRGAHYVQDVQLILGIKDTTLERLIQKAKDTTSDLYRELMEIGVSYHVHDDGKGGRGHRSWFEKVA